MSFSPQSKSNYSEFGFQPLQEEEQIPSVTEDYGFRPEPAKLGTLGSVGAGVAEGILGIPALVRAGMSYIPNKIYSALGREDLTNENYAAEALSYLPESEGEQGRRIRAGARGMTAGALGGIPGMFAGLIGSQAGQTIREVWGKDGKFENFGIGELSAMATDFLTGGIAGISTGATRASNTINVSGTRVPPPFKEATGFLDKKLIKHAVQSEKSALDKMVNEFSRAEIQSFEDAASQISPNRYTDFTNSQAANIQRSANEMFRSNLLSMINPLNLTTEEAGRTIQDAANITFQNNVLNAERQAYSAASQAAEGLEGQLPQTLDLAKDFLAELQRTPPTPEQQGTISYLQDLIQTLETTIPGQSIPASKLLNALGEPVTPATEIPAQQVPSTFAANNMIDLIQKGNNAVNYDSQFREQSHRLKPIVNSLRKEVQEVLDQNPTAAVLYQEANTLHGKNADIWDTKYMRNVRFNENPENIIAPAKKASNLANFQQAIPERGIQNILISRMIDDVTSKGTAKSNIDLLRNLSAHLSPEAQAVGVELSNIKDPLTQSGGRAAVRNEILKDAAQSVHTGKRPERILDLMQTPKGYNIVVEALNANDNSRNLFRAFQRLFVEDVFASTMDKTGMIDFKKAQNILQNHDMRTVVRQIGGDALLARFNNLEKLSQNFQKNLTLYKTPEAQTVFKQLTTSAKSASVLGAIMHALHYPVELIALLGAGRLALTAGKIGVSKLMDNALSNPKVYHYLDKLSQATTPKELTRYLPLVLAELDKVMKDKEEK